jgi:hypothetical protein
MIRGEAISLEGLEICTLGAAEMEEAVGVMVRGMRDNPNIVAAFGQDPGTRHRRLLRLFCARMDDAGEDAYLETDKEINVRWYERFGFEITGEDEVLGVRNWYMFRRARKGDDESR